MLSEMAGGGEGLDEVEKRGGTGRGYVSAEQQQIKVGYAV